MLQRRRALLRILAQFNPITLATLQIADFESSKHSNMNVQCSFLHVFGAFSTSTINVIQPTCLAHAYQPSTRLQKRTSLRGRQYNNNTAAQLSRRSPVLVQSLSSFQDELVADLPITWISHWQEKEEEKKFRKEIIVATRGRRRQRAQELLSLFTEHQEATKPPADSVVLHPPITDSIDDELTWLASHPEALGPDFVGSELPLCKMDWRSANQVVDQLYTLHMPVYNTTNGDSSSMTGSSSSDEEASIPVRPLWIAIHQDGPMGLAQLYDSPAPLETEIMKRLSAPMSPFASVTGLSFSSQTDVRHGPWHNFFVGLVGGVAVEEHEILWPNQILHKDRVLFNVRHGVDVARFLADPRPKDVQEHADNLERLAAERKYRKGWCWHMLRARWGEQALVGLGFTPDQFM